METPQKGLCPKCSGNPSIAIYPNIVHIKCKCGHESAKKISAYLKDVENVQCNSSINTKEIEELQNKITTSILYYMKEKNITVDDICQATKISIKRLNNLINPNTKTTIKIRELYYISYVLGVSINKLVNKEN